MQKHFRMPRRSLLCIGVLLVLVGCQNRSNGTDPVPTERDSLHRILQSRKIAIGYAGYPPYLRRDPNSGAISGYSVDLITHILKPLGVSIEWKETTWDNMKQDLILGKFDLMVEPIFLTVPRASQVGFTKPYAYFGYGIPVVRKDDQRFSHLDDLNSPNVTIAVTQGVTDQEFAQQKLPKAHLKLIPGNDITITLTEVLAGKADAALADVPTVLQFLKAHPRQVKALFLDNPPAKTPAAFLVRQDDLIFRNFLNTSISIAETDGFFDQLENKYALPSYREKRTWVVGKGLPQ